MTRRPSRRARAIASAGSSYTQNPEPRAGMAWCSPPPGWKAWLTSPRRIASIARNDPPATAADASCMPANAGVSPGPMPALERPERVARQRLDRLDVRRVVDPLELLVGRRLGSEIRHGPERLEERDARPEPARGQRVRPARSRTSSSAARRRGAARCHRYAGATSKSHFHKKTSTTDAEITTAAHQRSPHVREDGPTLGPRSTPLPGVPSR